MDGGRFAPLRKVCGLKTALMVSLMERLGKGTYSIHPRGIAHPLHLRQGTSDGTVLTDILGRQELALDLPFNPEVIIDAGANIGISTVFYANAFPRARILALEPDTESFELCQKNTRPYSNVKCVKAALWHRPGKVSLANPDALSWAHQFQESQESEQPLVLAITVREAMDLLGHSHVDILKMDIEGSEKEILLHQDGWLECVKVFVVELHEKFKPGCEAALDQAIAGLPVIRSRQREKTIIRSI